MVLTEQRSCKGETASLRSGKRYFVPDVHNNATSFCACDNYPHKLGRHGGKLSQRRYFYIGHRYGVRIYEAYNLHTSTWDTSFHRRLARQESKNGFIAVQNSYHCLTEDHQN